MITNGGAPVRRRSAADDQSISESIGRVNIMRHTRTILTAATALTLAGGLGFAMTGQANADPVVRTAHVTVYEDEPGWDCTTQGNRVCGVAGTYGEIFLVTFDESGQPVFVEHRDKTVWDYLPNNG